jgi:hypothetical protein
VIDGSDPFADDRLQLAKVEERVVLDTRAAAEHVRSLVAGQHLQQPLAQGAEEPFDGGLVGGGVGPGRLDGDAQPGAGAGDVLGDVDLAVVDHNGVR